MNIKNLVYEMLTESTGRAMMDSGDAYGRHWEANQKRSLKDFEEEEAVVCDDGMYTISVFHYITQNLKLDAFCDEFNKKPVKDWDSDIYGVSKKGKVWLLNNGFDIQGSFNTYNGESSLSQVLQGTFCEKDGTNYVLLQIHNGCDVRGGYTDAKLFLMPDDYMPTENVYGIATLKDGSKLHVSNTYNGYELTSDEDEAQGQELDWNKIKKVELELDYC